MKALRVNELLPDLAGVALEELATPKPQAGEVLVKIRAATLGFPDFLMTHGGYQLKPPVPFSPGMEGAGEIAALGADVESWAVGDKVVCGGLGTFADYMVMPAERLRKIPDNLDFATAAATGSAYLTAYVGLVRRGLLQKDEWLLVHGAAGGVGLAAVDLGKYLGAKIIATASSDEKLALIEEKFAPEAVININDGFREKVKELTGGGADVIYDPVGGDVFDESVRCIGWDGRLLIIGFADGRIPNIGVNMPLIKGFSVVGVRAGEYGRRNPEKGAENQEAIWHLAAEGKITPHVHARLPLSQWRDGFDMMAKREIVGRVIFEPDG
ncbi:MAG: NADPH:quinone oxidoreductase family protein [Parvibaculales bacterium]|jgi:NADPH2:quinone reductase